MKYFSTIIIFICLLFCVLSCKEENTITKPERYTYKISGEDSLSAYVFMPEKIRLDHLPAMVIFHGGGWTIGDPSWAFDSAEKYSKRNMVVIAAQYRLSDQKNVSPIDAVEDARDIIIWIRENADELMIDTEKIVAYGWSAGAHLAASSAVFPAYNSDSTYSSIPDALILHSPALSVVNDGWFASLLPDGMKVIDLSPAENIDGAMPPSIIVVGRDDTVTPVEGSMLYHRNMIEQGNISHLNIYEDVGHMFTPSDQPDNEDPKPDRLVLSKAFDQVDLFLEDLGYLNN